MEVVHAFYLLTTLFSTYLIGQPYLLYEVRWKMYSEIGCTILFYRNEPKLIMFYVIITSNVYYEDLLIFNVFLEHIFINFKKKLECFKYEYYNYFSNKINKSN